MTTYDSGPGPYQPVPPAPAAGGGNGKKIALIGGLGAGALVIGGGAVAATMFFSQGAQPAEALPADTIAYASLDLDPSGSQKLEIINTLRKFPAFTDQTDIDADSDLMEELFKEATESGECTDLDYAKDVKPWIGSRAAVAAVETGEDEPAPVVVLHTTNGTKAEDGIDKVAEACGGDTSEVGVTVSGDWVIFGETQDITDEVAEAAKKESLADDADYGRWTDEAGGEAILSVYVSKHVADYADQLADLGSGSLAGASPDFSSSDLEDDFSDFESDEPTDPATSEELRKTLEDFQGAAMALRFDDGGLEFEVAGGLPDQAESLSGSGGADLVSGLPDETVAALGIGLADGWLDKAAEQFDESGLSESSLEDTLAEVGLSIDDIENGLGEGIALALGSGLDVDAVANGGPEDLPAGVVVKADEGDVNDLITKVDDYITAQEGQSLLDTFPWLQAEAAGDNAVISPHEGYRGALTDPEDTLGDTSEYKSVVDGDAQGVVFVNFNADDDWLVRLAESEGDEDIVDNVKPLAAFGISWWVDGDVSHGKIRLTTD
ncbi:MAG: DUF3352 domain-containing protein [Nocardioides sp.]|uniref:DUF3352 domain-containing protein n=1 Tax=Nocardioides sp. TaxID=35761 RepID=UPI003F0DC2D3